MIKFFIRKYQELTERYQMSSKDAMQRSMRMYVKAKALPQAKHSIWGPTIVAVVPKDPPTEEEIINTIINLFVEFQEKVAKGNYNYDFSEWEYATELRKAITRIINLHDAGQEILALQQQSVPLSLEGPAESTEEKLGNPEPPPEDNNSN